MQKTLISNIREQFWDIIRGDDWYPSLTQGVVLGPKFEPKVVIIRLC
jgi:hypothetical protein